MDINIILFNNQIYGLTKGQYSPTSELGTVTKSSPFGTIDNPLHPLSVALAAEATFVARTYDKNPKHMSEIFEAAAKHKGISFVEVYQNCIIFNDGVFENVTGKEVRDDHTLMLEHGKPLIFGKDRDKGIIIEGTQPRVVKIEDVGIYDIHIHNAQKVNPDYAFALTRFHLPEYPTPMGIFREVKKPIYNDLFNIQINEVIKQKGKGDLNKLLYSGDVWEVN